MNPTRDWDETVVVGGKIELKIVLPDDDVDDDDIVFEMLSFKEMQSLLILNYDEGLINDEEFALLYDNFNSINPDFPLDALQDIFNLEQLEESVCLADFRFRKGDIPALAQALQIPASFTCAQGTTCDGLEGLCMLLRRCSYPCRYSDMIKQFGKPVPVLSMVTNTVLEYLYETHGHRVTQWNNLILDPVSLQRYADAVTAKGAPLNNCFGFVDGTVRPVSRPGKNQRILYNGHKRVHALKFQSVVLPNGLIGNMYGPVGKNNLIS